MSGRDERRDAAELEDLRARVDCRLVLERAGWELDARESTRGAAKYRAGAGRIVIVTHEGRGWFDPLNDKRGDVLALAQHVWGGTLGHARKALRPLAGLSPTLSPMHRETEVPEIDAEAAWRAARELRKGSQGWTYLVETRGLPEATIERALKVSELREGICGTVWAMHQGVSGRITGWEMRGPKYKGFSKGGRKALFWLGHPAVADRVTVTESAIDSLSLASLEGWPEGTVYVSTGGGYRPETGDALGSILPRGSVLVAATDRGVGGNILAHRLRELASGHAVDFTRLVPTAKDWNAQLTGGDATNLEGKG